MSKKGFHDEGSYEWNMQNGQYNFDENRKKFYFVSGPLKDWEGELNPDVGKKQNIFKLVNSKSCILSLIEVRDKWWFCPMFPFC
jgi:hypothetical protein